MPRFFGSSGSSADSTRRVPARGTPGRARGRVFLGRAFLGVLAAVLLGAGWIQTRAPENLPDRSEHPERLRVVTYNIRAALGGLDAVAQDLAALSPDLVALQEVEKDIPRSRSQDQAGHLGRALDMEWSFAGSFSVDEGEHGIAVLSRFPILDATILELPQSSGRWPRVALEVLVDGPHGPIRFVAVHLARPWGWPLSNTRARLQQIDTLLDSLEAGPPAPTIVAGDFNSLPISAEGWKMSRHFDHAWHPARDGWATSFPLAAIGWPAGAVKIDHVYHDSDWRSHGTWVAPQGASDHRPVLAELSLK